MPSALETLVKILKLEREQGCRNTAVIGGFQAYSSNWHKQAADQARNPEQSVLIDEIADILNGYEVIDNKTERMKQIGYVLDRIMGRVAAPPEYQRRLETADGPVSDASRKSRKPRRSERRKQKSDQQPDEKRGARPPATSQDSSSVPGYDPPADDFNKPIHTGKLDIVPPPRLARPPRKPRPVTDPQEALAKLRLLAQPVTAIKGIGDSIANRLEGLGILTIRDMLYYLPRRYDDYTQLRYISQLEPGAVSTIIATVAQAEVRVGRGSRKDFSILLDDGSAHLSVTFFGQHFLSRQIRPGQQIVVSGKVAVFRDILQMANPEWEHLDAENLHTVGIVPVYALSAEVRPRAFRRSMKQLVDDWAGQVPDYVPSHTLERADLGDLSWALENLHFPLSMEHLEHARRRFIFDELLLLQLAILQHRREWQSVPGQALVVPDEFLETFISSTFPYALTQAQRRAIQDIRRDVTRDVPMNRLIQGDVGAGKTAVAIVAMAMAINNEKQAAIMAPTSILAEQHYRSISATLGSMPNGQRPVVALLTSALSQSERESVLRGLADGSIDIVIGTHALIQDGVEFRDLAVAVIDEQHRFGVEQRGRLRGKGTNPHLLVMTATPIPRTLALTMYADLDLTVIDEKPPGRKDVQTQIVYPVERERAFSFIESQLQQGRQAFVVHPLVEASDKIEARSASDAFDELQVVFHRYRVCLLHGRMKPAEKDEIMAAFAAHEYDVMVTTSVAEVGVDVPNASVIMIEGANRFGLAQLHQFRGRVGRGQHDSFCLLLPDSDTPESRERLSAMVDTNDGFRLAELDWKLRGAGDLLGTRQSGTQKLQLLEQMTPELVSLAQREARTIFEEDPSLDQAQHALLAQMIHVVPDDDVDMS